jgi:hypothetical protein
VRQQQRLWYELPYLPYSHLYSTITSNVLAVGAGVGFPWLEAVGVTGPCPVSQDRWRQLLWVVVCGVWWAVGPVVVSLLLGCGSGWPSWLWVEPRRVTQCVWGS